MAYGACDKCGCAYNECECTGGRVRRLLGWVAVFGLPLWALTTAI